jgi:hypothetical protein
VEVTFHHQTIWEIIDMVRNAVLMFGMHGAGWTHAAFLRPGSAALQLVPHENLDQEGTVVSKPCNQNPCLQLDRPLHSLPAVH